MNELSREQLEQIEKALTEHNQTLGEINAKLNTITRELSDVETKREIIQNKVNTIEDKVNVLSQEFENESGKVSQLKNKMNDMEHEIDNIKNNKEWQKNKAAFNDLQESIKNCGDEIDKTKDKCIDLMRKAAIQRQEASQEVIELSKQQIEAANRDRQALDTLQKIMENERRVKKSYQKVDNIGGIFARSMINANNEYNAALKSFRIRREAVKKVTENCAQLDAQIGNNIAKTNEIQQRAAERVANCADDISKCDKHKEELLGVLESNMEARAGNVNVKGDMDPIDQFLDKLQLGHLSEAFKDGGIATEAELEDLSHRKLKQIGIESKQTRIKIMAALADLAL